MRAMKGRALALVAALFIFDVAYAQTCPPPTNPQLEDCLDEAEDDYISGLTYCAELYGPAGALPSTEYYSNCVQNAYELLISDRGFCYNQYG